VKRSDRRSGQVLPLTHGYGGAVRPTVSPDGSTLAFGRRIDASQVLVLRDLETGRERVVYRGLDRDEQETAGAADFLPGFTFTPDGESIIIGARGKIRRIRLATGTAEVIPFTARFEQTLTERVTAPWRLDDGPVKLKLFRWHQSSPDGRRIVFGAAGRNYLYDVAARSARPFGDGPGLEAAPAISPDGRWVAWVEWRDSVGGHVYKAPIEGGSPTRLTAKPAHYVNPSWSPDGTRLVVLQGSGGEFRGERGTETLYYEVRWLDASGPGPARLITGFSPRGIRRQIVRPKFDRTGQRVYFSDADLSAGFIAKSTDLVSVALDGTDRRRHLRFQVADDLVPSPDGKWVVFTEAHNVYLVPFPAAGEGPVDVKLEGGVLPVRRLSQEGGAWVDWTPDGQSVTWGWGPTFYRLPLTRAREAAGVGSPDTVAIAVTEPRALPEGRILLRGARIVTMGPAGVIERGNILVENGRIKAVGRGVTAPAGTRIVDVSGKTIMPGLMDLHAHYYDEDTELLPERDWALAAQLAYGVTTIRDVSVRSQTIFTLAEMVETGRIVGPRILSTGDIIWGWNAPFSSPVKSLDDARQKVRRLKALGATLVKQYMQRRREQRQWVVQAAREERMVVTPEGGGDTFFDLTMVMDGHSGLEHAIPTAPLYQDVVSLIAAAGTDYVPTLIVGYGGPTVETYFHQVTDVHDDPKLRRFTPHLLLDEKARRRQLMHEEDYHFKSIATAAAAILKAGGNVGVGAHGNRQGLGTHWELWGLAMGGLTPLEALRTATTIPAAAMGLAQDLGTLEPGKMADLLVLDANPLDNIRNTEQLAYVMKAGVLRDARTLDEIWPRAAPFGAFYWAGYDAVK
jgi:imidazolonepropionase-like amidohydrolase